MSTRARYIAVEGPPGAGVGILAERLAAQVGARLVRDVVADNPFLDGFSSDPRRFAFQAQLYFLLARYRQQGELLQEDLFQRGVVADYLFARDHIWSRLVLAPEEQSLYDKVHALLVTRVPRPDLVVYLTARPEVLRARLRRRVRATDRVVDSGAGGLIDDITEAMGRYFFDYTESPLLIVNTSELSFEAAEEATRLDEIIGVIGRTRAGVNHYVPG